MLKPIIASTSYPALFESAKKNAKNGNLKGARDDLRKAGEVLSRLAFLSEDKDEKKELLGRKAKLDLIAGCINVDASLLLKGEDEKAIGSINAKKRSSKNYFAPKNPKKDKDQSDEGGHDFFAAEKPTITMDDVAGLDDVKKQIDEQIIKPEENPDLYQKFKKSKGSGILLYGLPGTGKTMIAKAIANKLDAPFFSIKCSDILSKWLGESEQNIKKLFSSAREYRLSIIFFDEFEAIGASREDTDSTEKNLVPEILAEMQGFEDNEASTVICIAATNRPWMIDTAFLRPGRFGTHFRVDLPNKEARMKIFKSKLAGIPHDPNIDFDNLVELTDGFNSADVSDGFIETMKQSAINRALESGRETIIDDEDVKKAAETCKSTVSKSDQDNLKKFESGDMDKFVNGFAPEPKPSVSFADVAGLQAVKDEINNEIIKPRLHPEVYKSFNKKIETGILLYGLPGTGKTMIAKAIAHELDAAFFSVRCSDILSKWVGGSENNVRHLFDSARQFKVSIIFFDEFEAIGSKRDESDKETSKLVPEILAQIQGFSENKNTLLVLAATNRPWMIDSAFLRPGRFGTHIRVDLPDGPARLQIVKNRLKNTPVAPDLDYEKIVALTEGFNGADVSDSFIEKAKQFAIDRSLNGEQGSQVTNDDILKAAQIVHSTVDPEDVANMEKFERGEIK